MRKYPPVTYAKTKLKPSTTTKLDSNCGPRGKRSAQRTLRCPLKIKGCLQDGQGQTQIAAYGLHHVYERQIGDYWIVHNPRFKVHARLSYSRGRCIPILVAPGHNLRTLKVDAGRFLARTCISSRRLFHDCRSSMILTSYASYTIFTLCIEN